MNMKLISAAVMVITTLGSQAAFAANDGTVTFSGTVKAATCMLDTPNISANMGVVPTASLSSQEPGDIASPYKQPLSIKFVDCPAAAAGAKLTILGTNNKAYNNHNHHLMYTDAGTPKNSAIMFHNITDGADDYIDVGKENAITMIPGNNTVELEAILIRANQYTIDSGAYTANFPFEITYK